MRYHIFPISQLEEVENIFIIRDTPGIKIDKVKYYCPPKRIVAFAPLSFIYKQILMIILTIYKKPDYIHGYLFFPHGILALITSLFTSKSLGISILAGPVELYSIGSPIGKYQYDRPLPKHNLFLRIYRVLLTNATYITVTGSYTKRFLENLGFSSNKIFIIPHFLPKEDRLITTSVPKTIDVLYVGRLAAVKHVEIFIQAIALVKSIIPKLKVVIVGDGEDRNKLFHLVKKLSINDIVIFTGYRSDVEKFYNSAKITVITSEREGFPIVAIESMMCGTPLISSKCGDITDILINGYNCMLTERYDDFEEYMRLIITVLGDDDLYKKLVNNVNQTVKKFEINKITKIWEIILTREK